MIDFLKYRSLYAAISCILFAAFIGGFVYKLRQNATGSAFVYSVEFTGGLEVLYKVSQPVSSEKVTEILEKVVFRASW